jgi:hypothetical protein
MVCESFQHNGYRALATSFDQDGGGPFDEIARRHPVPTAKEGVDLEQTRQHVTAHAGTISPTTTLGLRKSPGREALPGEVGRLLPRIKKVGVRPVETVHSEVSALVGRVTTRVGGPARLRVVLLLAGVLSLQSADIGTIGALAEELEKALRVDNTELGLLTTAASLVGAVAALPVGVLADRSNRVRLLVWATAAWSVGMAASGFADGT